MMMPAMPSRANAFAALPPALDSLIVPVSGLLAPIDRRPEHGAPVPPNHPGAMTSVLAAPKA